jgi:hypothetical protein
MQGQQGIAGGKRPSERWGNPAGQKPICYGNSSAKVTQTVFRPALRAGLELALAARAAPDVAVLVLGHPEAAVHPASAEVEDEAPAQ